MPETSHITFTDQFCGSGGSSQGVRRFAERSGNTTGVTVRLALNHDKIAISTHEANFPDTQHDCTDIQACDPRFYPKTTILITSPECTNHSVAKGKKQVKAQMDMYAKGARDAMAERSRATMWDVVRFTEQHRYRIVITENVVDARAWELWEPWLLAMHALGYEHKCVFFNSMFAWPTPQSRDRMYVVFWRKGQRKPDLDFRPLAACPKCEQQVHAIQSFKPKANVKAKYGTQYVYVCPRCATTVTPFYYAAINAIDWTVPAVRIGDRPKPLEPRTMQRIAFGMEKYGRRPLAITVHYKHGTASRVRDALTQPGFTEHTYQSSAICSPFTVETKYSHAGPNRATGAQEPLSAQTGQASKAVVLPFTVDTSFTKAGGEYTKGPDDALGTQTTTQSKGVVIPPALVVDTNYYTDHVRPMDGVLPAQTGANKLGVAFDGAMTMSLNYPEQAPKPLDAPLDTQTGSRPMSLVSPYMVNMRGTEPGHVKSSAHGLDDPIGTISAGGFHHALLSGKATAFLASYYGQTTDSGIDEPMGTLTTKERHTLLAGDQPMTRIEDLYFRMLKPHEVQAGMAFASDYIVLGNGRQKVKQLGNAVTPPVMEMLVERCVASLDM